MSDTNKRILPLYIILFIYFVINTFIKFTSLSKIYISIINPLFLLLIAILTYFLTIGYRNRTRNKYLKRQNVLIIVIGYILIYYLSGIAFGFLKNGYSLSLNGIISNFISFFTIVIFEEYIRYRLIASTKKKINLYLITLIFILINIDFHYLVDINNSISVLQYVFEGIVPVIILNITLTYLAYRVSFTASLLYRGILTAITLFSPIIPNHEWILTNFLYLMVLMFLIISIDYLTLLDDKRTRKRELKNEKSSWGFFAVALLFILFVIGVFKYQPIAIMSNSMYDYFSRGDAVVIEKLNEKEKANIEIGDIIHYKHGGTYITHRVIYKENRNGSYVFFTKGDNNEIADDWEVYESDINGIIRFKIKYLGWPSVWLAELLS